MRRPTRSPARAGARPPRSRFGLARAISKLGYCSRSEAARLIRAGRVRLNGAIRRDPETSVALAHSRIEIDGRPVSRAQKIYLMLNKPRGLVTTASDEKGRDTVYSCLPPNRPWLAPVGRLDRASEGLLLFTNDSEWAARLLDPHSRVSRTYHVQIGAIADEKVFASLSRGVHDDGELLSVTSARILRHGQRNSWLEIVLNEGKNRHIRRMFAALDIEVLRLVRVAIGPLVLGTLAKGEVRPLTSAEIAALSPALAIRR